MRLNPLCVCKERKLRWLCWLKRLFVARLQLFCNSYVYGPREEEEQEEKEGGLTTNPFTHSVGWRVHACMHAQYCAKKKQQTDQDFHDCQNFSMGISNRDKKEIRPDIYYGNFIIPAVQEEEQDTFTPNK